MTFEVIASPLRARLLAGGTALVATTQIGPSGAVAQIFGQVGFDALVLDAEHALLAPDSVTATVQAALAAGITPLLRLPGASAGLIGQALAMGALGVVVPHVESAVEAEQIARAGRFAPRGRRSIPPGFPHFSGRSVGTADAMQALEAATLLVVMIESGAAAAQADAIAAVPGIDVLFMGANDLAAAAGHPGDTGHPAVWQAAADVVTACRRHGKVAGIGGITTEAQLARAHGLGMRYLSAAHDATLLRGAASARADGLRALLPAGTGTIPPL